MKPKAIVMTGAVFFMLNNAVSAQYQPVKTAEGVEFSVKWASQKWFKPKGPKVLLVKVTNTNDWAVNYTLGVDVSRDGLMLESSEEATHCIKKKSVAKGRLNGIVYPMVSISQDDIKSENFDLELTGTEVKKTEKCEKKNN